MEQQSLWDFILQQKDKLFDQTVAHIGLTFISLFIAVLIGLPLGIFIAKRKKAAGIVLNIAGVLQTIPSIALPHGKPLPSYHFKGHKPHDNSDNNSCYRPIFSSIKYCCVAFKIFEKQPTSFNTKEGHNYFHQYDRNIKGIKSKYAIYTSVMDTAIIERSIHFEYMLHKLIIGGIICNVSKGN